MAPADYRKTLEDAKKELEELLIGQEETERRIARLKQVILALTPLAEEPGSNGLLSPNDEIIKDWLGLPGMTQTCLEIFKAATGPLTPVEIKQKLIDMGVDLSAHKNVMASVHSTLKRLDKQGQITTRDNGLTYQRKTWIARAREVGAFKEAK
ncbi:MAG: hypothetical protein WBE13_00445 [Candidatus Acidiferrum sp.]